MLTEARESLNRYYGPELGERFVSAGMCLYRDGRDSVAWHGDRIGRGRSADTMVAIVSFGSPRPLMLRPVGGGQSLRFPLGHGDLVVMGGSCQRTWEHCIPKTTKPVGPAGERAVPARRRGLSAACVGVGRFGTPLQRPLGGRVLFSMRRADREVRRTSPPAGVLETGVVLDIQPASEAREGRVFARPLFENSTACRKSVPSNTPCQGLGFWFGIPLVD